MEMMKWRRWKSYSQDMPLTMIIRFGENLLSSCLCPCINQDQLGKTTVCCIKCHCHFQFCIDNHRPHHQHFVHVFSFLSGITRMLRMQPECLTLFYDDYFLICCMFFMSLKSSLFANAFGRLLWSINENINGRSDVLHPYIAERRDVLGNTFPKDCGIS